jgi:hypothetical protein
MGTRTHAREKFDRKEAFVVKNDWLKKFYKAYFLLPKRSFCDRVE